MNTLKRKLAAILSADVAGYSRLMDEDEVSTVRTLQAYQQIISDLTSQHNGRVVDSPGDNLMAEFASVVDAVKCAVEIQNTLSGKNAELPDDRKMEFRIGINLGDVIEEDDRIYGDGVNIAARVESLAEAGGICISGRVYDQVENKIDVEYEDLGEHRAKNIKRPIRIYKIPIELDKSILEPLVDLTVPTDKPSIAVLPFVNMSGDPEQEYFSDGITEEIITALSKVPNLLVIARNSTFTYKGKAVNVKQVGKELGVKFVLEGSVRKAGNRIRVTAQLIDASTGNHLWAERYDRGLEDIFVVQDEITLKIVTELQVTLSDLGFHRRFTTGTNNLEAYLKYLQALQKIPLLNKSDNAIARQLLEEVINLDPKWSIGYQMLGMAHIVDFWAGWSSFPEKSIEEGLKLTKKAIALDDSLALSYGNMSQIYLYKRQYNESIAEAEKAILLQPNSFWLYQLLGYALIYAGEPTRAINMSRKAIRLNPFDWLSTYHLGIAHCDLQKYDEAISYIKKALKLNPDSLHAHAYLVATYSLAGQKENAFNIADEVLRIDPQFYVDNFADRIPYKNQSDTDRILNALRKAGLE